MVALMAIWLGAAYAAPLPPVERATLVLVRALSYDRSITGSAALRIAVILPSADPEVGNMVMKVVDELRGVTVAGRPIDAPVRLTSSETDWATALRSVDAVVLCPGIEGELPEIKAAARQIDVLLLSLEPAYVGRGAALGVKLDGSKLELRVDLTEASQQGASFAGELLELAHRVDQP
jgi:hypothetical protein